MKLLRLGKPGQEILAAIDKNGKYRNLSLHLKDLIPETINFKNLEKLKKIDLENLDEIDRFCDAMISIRLEVDNCTKENKNNLLCNASPHYQNDKFRKMGLPIF